MSEPLDRNKTDITHRATATAAAWLSGLGCKPVETEVNVGQGWVADLATFWTPTMTEAGNAKIIDGNRQQRHERFERWSREVGGRVTLLVEVKVTREDFRRDLGRKYGLHGKNERAASMRPLAHLCVLAVTGHDVIKSDEHLVGWSLLRLSEDGSRVLKFDYQWRLNPLFPIDIENLIADVAIRRDHHTRYGSLRRWLKTYRAERSQQNTARKTRISEVMERFEEPTQGAERE